MCLRRGGHTRPESHRVSLLPPPRRPSHFCLSPSSFSAFVSSSIMLSLPPAAAFTFQPASMCFSFPSHSPPSAAILSLQPVFAVMRESCWPTSTLTSLHFLSARLSGSGHLYKCSHSCTSTLKLKHTSIMDRTLPKYGQRPPGGQSR